MTTVSAGSSGTYTFTTLSTVAVTLNASEHAIVVVTNGTSQIYADRLSSTRTIGPFPSGAVMLISADGPAIDYVVTAHVDDGNFSSYTGKEAVSYSTNSTTGQNELDPNSSAALAASGFYIPSGRFKFERELSTRGVVGTAGALDGAAVQEAINAFSATTNKRALLPPGLVISIDQPLTMDASKFRLDMQDGGFDFSALTTASSKAISFTNTQSVNDYNKPWVPLANGSILRRKVDGSSNRDDSYNNSIVGLYFDSAATPGASNLTFTNLYVEGFRDGAYLGRNSYLLAFEYCQFIRNYTGVASRNVTAGTALNQGERMVFSACTFANNYEHMDVEGEYIFVNHTSFDYPSVPSTAITNIANRRQRMMSVRKGARVRLRDCHMEGRDNSPASNDRSWIYLEDSLSSFKWEGGVLALAPNTWDSQALSNGADGYPTFANLDSLVQVGGTGVANLTVKPDERAYTSLFASRGMVKLRDSSSVPPSVIDVGGDDDTVGGFTGGKSIATFVGDASQTNGRGFGLLRQPTFGAALNEDLWYICGSGQSALAGQNGRLTSTSVNVTVASNTLTITKTSAAASAARLNLLVPIERFKKLGLRYTANTSVNASVPSGINFVTIVNPNTYSVIPQAQTIKSATGSTSLALTSADTVIDLHSYTSATAGAWDTGDRSIPIQATHAQITWTLDSFDGSGTSFALNLKNFTICCM